MNPSSPNRHQQPIRLVTGAGHFRHYVEAQTDWGIKKFVPRTAADPLPDDLHNARIQARIQIRADCAY
jgi:hypothetical protein